MESVQLITLANRILREWRRLNEIITTGLTSIQEQICSIRDQQEAATQHQQQKGERPQILNAELQIPEAIQRNKRTSDNRQFAVQAILAAITFLAFLAAAIYAGINYHMLGEMRKANKSATDSFAQTLCQMQAQTSAQTRTAGAAAVQASNSEKSLTAAIDNFHLEQRAWFGVYFVKLNPLKVNEPISISMGFINTGKTPGFGSAASYFMAFSPYPLKRFPRKGGNPASIAVLTPNLPLADIVKGDFTLSQAQIDAINHGKWLVYLYGYIDYRDVFSNKLHTTSYCVRYNWEQGQGTFSEPVECGRLNYAN